MSNYGQQQQGGYGEQKKGGYARPGSGRAQLSLTAQDSEDMFPFSDPKVASRAALAVADKLTTMLAQHGDRTALVESALICLRAGDRSGAVVMMQRAVDVSLAGLMPAAPELKIGDRVTCKYGGGSEEYPGSITGIGANSTFDVTYDDGDAESSVARSLITLVDDDHAADLRVSGCNRGW